MLTLTKACNNARTDFGNIYFSKAKHILAIEQLALVSTLSHSRLAAIRTLNPHL